MSGCGWWGKRRKPDAESSVPLTDVQKTHVSRCRQVDGCIKCGKELHPGEAVFVCGEVQHSVFSAVKVFFPLFLPLLTDLLAGQHISKSANYAVFATSTYMIQPCDMTQHQV